MSLNQIIKSAVEPIVPVCVPDLYTGEAEEYCTFNYTEKADCFGDDEPEVIVYLVQLHWFLPTGQNPLAKKKAIRRALMAADFTCPEVLHADDEDGQHYIFECEYVDGDV